MGFSQALSGLNAAANNLDVIGNNIANSQTVGFKSSSTLFSDVYAGAKAGLGTRVAAVLQDFSNGNLESTGRNMDLAIDGEGFFRLVQNNQVVYSRNGQFSINSEGYIQNAQGAQLTGFLGEATSGDPQPLRIPTGSLAARATQTVEASLNLDSRSTEIDRVAVPFNAADADTYSYANNITLYDSQGNSHTGTLYFTKLDSAPNTWEFSMALGSEVTPAQTVEFDTNGINTTGGNVNITFDPDPGQVSPINFTLDMSSTTQFGRDFELSSANQDGYTAGSLVGVGIDKEGRVFGNYSNEQAQQVGTITMARFRSTEGLTPVGDNAWAESNDSGQALLGLAGAGQLGRLESGAIETSNVDLTRELVDMIIAQRNYQANSQTIKTQDEVLQNAINLK